MSDEREILDAVQSFYDAFNEMSLEAMASSWSQRDEDVCVHPGWEILRGWRSIRESWRVIFANTGYTRVRLSDLTLDQVGDAAWVCGVENLYTVIGQHTFHSRVAAVNVLIRTSEGWKVTAHHGSPIATDSEPDFEQDADDFDVN